MTQNYPNPYEQPNPYGGGPDTRSYDTNPLKSQAIKGGVMIAIFAVGVLIVGGAIQSKIFSETHDWLSSYKAEGRASKDGKYLIVIRHDPRSKRSQRFFKEVLHDSRVVARTNEFIWCKEDTNGKLKRRDDDYGNLRSHGDGNSMPHIFIYNPSLQCVDGHLRGNEMSADQFLALLDEAIAGTRGDEEGDDEEYYEEDDY